MKIAVTGASGFVGRHFVSMYGDKYEIVALTRDASRINVRPSFAVQKTDYSIGSLTEILKDCDGIIHLAYALATKANEEAGDVAYAPSERMTENILEAARVSGIDNIVFTSSRLVYPAYKESPFTETDEAAPINYYGHSKVRMEELCCRYNAEYGMHIKCLRLGQVIGDDMHANTLFSVFFNNAKQGLPLRLIGRNVRDYIYIKDVCRGIDCALSNPERGGIYNISMGIGTDNRRMADGIIRALASSSAVEFSTASQDSKADRIVLDCNKAREELGFACGFDTIEKITGDIIDAYEE